MNWRYGEERACERCGSGFASHRVGHRYCSDRCRQSATHQRITNAAPIRVVEFCCDMCGVEQSDRYPIVRFSLKRAIRAIGDRRATTRGVGTIFLCQRCWDLTAGRRRNLPGPRRIEAAA